MSSAPDPESVSGLKSILIGRLAKFDVLREFPGPSPTARDAKTLTPAFFKIQREKYDDILAKAGVYKDDIPSIEDRFSELGRDSDIGETKKHLGCLDGALNTAYEALGGDAANPYGKTSWRVRLLRWEPKDLCSKEHVLSILKSLDEIFKKLDVLWKNRRV